jgi:hypothetical protein
VLWLRAAAAFDHLNSCEKLSFPAVQIVIFPVLRNPFAPLCIDIDGKVKKERAIGCAHGASVSSVNAAVRSAAERFGRAPLCWGLRVL